MFDTTQFIKLLYSTEDSNIKEMLNGISNYVKTEQYIMKNSLLRSDNVLYEAGSKFHYNEDILIEIEYIPSILDRKTCGSNTIKYKFTKEEWKKYEMFILLMIYNLISHVGDSSKPEVYYDYDISDDFREKLKHSNNLVKPPHSFKIYAGYQYDERLKMLNMDWCNLFKWMYKLTTIALDLRSELSEKSLNFNIRNPIYVEDQDKRVIPVKFFEITQFTNIFIKNLENYKKTFNENYPPLYISTFIVLDMIVDCINPRKYAIEIIEYLTKHIEIVYDECEIIFTDDVMGYQIINRKDDINDISTRIKKS